MRAGRNAAMGASGSMPNATHIAELRKALVIQERVLAGLELEKSKSASESETAKLESTIRSVEQHLRDLELILQAHLELGD
jgi:hypothetical protein